MNDKQVSGNCMGVFFGAYFDVINGLCCRCCIAELCRSVSLDIEDDEEVK